MYKRQGLDSPDNTSDGVLSKRWVCRNGERCLLKGGTLLDQEPYNEVIATELFSRLLSDGDYVPCVLYTSCLPIEIPQISLVGRHRRCGSRSRHRRHDEHSVLA